MVTCQGDGGIRGAPRTVLLFRTCGPQKPLRVEICMTPGADSELFLRLFHRTLFGVLALCEAGLPCCHFEAFGSVTSARALLYSGNCWVMDVLGGLHHEYWLDEIVA